MASSVSFLSNNANSSTALLPSKPISTPDDDGSGFQSELSKASDRQSQAAQDSGDSSNSADSTTDAKKTDKSKDSDSTKKTQAKGKSKKPQAGDQPAEDEADETTVVAKKTGQPATPVDPADAQAEDADAVPVDPTKPTAGKAKPGDPKAVVDPTAIQSQAKTAVAAKAADADDQEEDAATAGSVPVATKAAATAVQSTDPHAADNADAAADATDPATAVAAKSGKAAATSLFNNDDDTAEVQPKQVAAKKSATAGSTDSAADDAQAIAQYISDLISPDAAKPQPTKPGADSKDALTAVATATTPKTTATPTGVTKTAQPAPPPETQFADANHPDIVKGIQTQLLPHGGTMQLRLDPPELGSLQVTLTMKDGVMNATFQTSNDDATRLLSHSMTQLKAAMESAGISVDKLQVQHTPKDSQTNTSSDDQSKGQTGQDDLTRQQDQQRKETIKRMWRKLAGESDPLDMVA